MKLENNPYYIAAVEYAKTHDLKTLSVGKHEIDGKNLWLTIFDAVQKPLSQARYEVHDAYIDLQIPISKAESFGVKPRAACTKPDGQMNIEKDILFFDDEVLASELVTVQPGEMIAFGPDTAHAPNLGEGGNEIKAVFKIKVID